MITLLTFATALSGCSGDNDAEKVDASTLLPRLENAKEAIDEATTLEVALTTSSLPSGVSGLLSATGVGNHSPAFKGEVKVVTGGATISAEIVSVDGTVYAKTDFSPLYLEVDPASLGAPNPATLLATDGGISELLVRTQDLSAGGKSRDGSDVLTSIKGTLPGSAVQTLIPSVEPSSSFSVVYRLTEDDRLRDATIKGPFYGDEPVTYTIEVDTSDEPVTITAP